MAPRRLNITGWLINQPACVTIGRAGDADLGSRLRRRRREVALANIIADMAADNLTPALRLPYGLRWISEKYSESS